MKTENGGPLPWRRMMRLENLEFDPAPLIEAIRQSSLSLAELAKVAYVYGRDITEADTLVERLGSVSALWDLAEKLDLDPDKAAAAAWPDWLVSWLACARVGKEGFAEIEFGDFIAPGYYLVSSEQGISVVIDWTSTYQTRVLPLDGRTRSGAENLESVNPVEDDTGEGLSLRLHSAHRWRTEAGDWEQPPAVSIQRVSSDQVDLLRRDADPNAGRPLVALDIDGVLHPLVQPWLVGETPRVPVPPMPEGLEERPGVALLFDRDAWRARFLAEHGTSALAELDRLKLAKLSVDWETWPENPRHRPWRMAFGTAKSEAAQQGWVPFVVDYSRPNWQYVPEHLAIKPDGSSDRAGRRWYAPLTAEIEVLLVPWVGRWVRKLIARGVEVVWSTTWEGKAANAWFGPAVGLPPLEYGQEGTSPRMSEETLPWKISALRTRYIDRPIAVLDDHRLHYNGGRNALHLTLGDRRDAEAIPSLLVPVDDVRGLTRANARQVERWLDSLVQLGEPSKQG